MNNIFINPDLIGRQVQWSDNQGYHEGIIIGASASSAGVIFFLIQEDSFIRSVDATYVSIKSQRGAW